MARGRWPAPWAACWARWWRIGWAPGADGRWWRNTAAIYWYRQHDLDLADRWFARHGDIIILIGRLLPVVRTFIAFPAGVARMPLLKFILYTFIGSFIWCWALAWVGQRLGEHWDTLGTYFHRFDALIGVLMLLGLVWWVWRHLRHLRTTRRLPVDTSASISDNYLIAPI